jgi:two-component system, NarL family, nitrate/nitrite response regulator NarL
MSADGQMSSRTALIKVLLVESPALLVDALSASINLMDGFVLDNVADLDAALAQIASAGRYDVVLLDQETAGRDHLRALLDLSVANGGNVALFGSAITWVHVDSGLAQGVAGYIPKSTRLKVLIHAIRLIAEGEIYLPADYVLRTTIGHAEDPHLKPREMRVLAYLCEGLQNKEIADRLDADQSVVKMDMRNICRKLGVHNRTQAVIKAQKDNLV